MAADRIKAPIYLDGILFTNRSVNASAYHLDHEQSAIDDESTGVSTSTSDLELYFFQNPGLARLG